MWLWFVEKGWLYCMLIMGVVLTVQLIIHWKDWTFLRKMGAFTVIVLVFHVMEECVCPVFFFLYFLFLFEKIFFDFFCNKMVVLNFLIFYYKRSIYT